MKPTAIIVASYGRSAPHVDAARRAALKWNLQVGQHHIYYVILRTPHSPPGLQDLLGVVKAFRHPTTIIDITAGEDAEDIFQKESLFNIGAKRAISDGCQTLVFLDGDVWSENIRWWQEIAATVESNGDSALVQVYRRFRDTRSGRTGVSVGAYREALLSHDVPRHPGFGWAMSAALWTQAGGLNPWLISGSGDVMLLGEFAGGFNLYPSGEYLKGKSTWWEPTQRHIEPAGVVTAAPVDIYHEYHGEHKDRAYMTSRIVLGYACRHPCELVRQHRGILVWRNPRHRLRRVLTSKKDIATDGMLKAKMKEVGFMKHNYENVFGFFTFPGLYRRWVHEVVPEGGTIVELGVLLGKSLCFLGVEAHNADRGLHVHGVDIFRPMEGKTAEFYEANGLGHKGDDIYPLFIANLKAAGLQDFVAIHRCDIVEASSHFADGSVDAVMNDADHSVAGVTRALQAWWPKLKVGGRMALHDYGHLSFSGVKVAADRWGAEHGVSWVRVEPLTVEAVKESP